MTREDVIERLNSGDKDFYYEDLSCLDLNHLDFSDANLRDANLRSANLLGTDLRVTILCGAIMDDKTDIDYACWPLWCGGLHVKIDKHIACQLAMRFLKPR